MQKTLLALHAATCSESFRKAAVQFIQAVVPCDRILVILHYPYQYGRSTSVWSSDGFTMTEEYIRASYACNPALPMLMHNPGLKVHRFTDLFASEEEMERNHFFIHSMKARGTRYASALMFWNKTLDFVDCALNVDRDPHRKNFDEEEMATLRLVHGHIEAAYERVNQIQNEISARNSLRDLVAKLPLPMMLLNWELEAVYHNTSARDTCVRWAAGNAHFKHKANACHIPDDLIAQMREMQEEWSLVLRTNPFSTKFKSRSVQHTAIPGLRALLEMTTLRSPHFGKPSFLVRFEQEAPAGGDPLSSLARLSPKERNLVELVCEGRSNQEIADTLGRSLSTVKSGLYGVFKKLNITSRTKLLKLLR